MATLYENIKKRRKELGLTQTELAVMVGYADKDMICKIEKGMVDLKESRIKAFAEALNLPPAVLFGDGSYHHKPYMLFVNEEDENKAELDKLFQKADENQRATAISAFKAILDE